MKKPTETDLVRTVLTYLRIQYPYGVWWRANTGAGVFVHPDPKKRRFVRYGALGMSDIQGVLNGRAIFLECKTATGKQSPAQRAFEKSVVNAGAKYHVVRRLNDLDGLL